MNIEILRNEISRTTSIYSNFDSDPNNIVITNGGKQAIFNSLIAILDPGDEVLIPTPYWTTYPEAVKISGGVPNFVETNYQDNFKVSVEQLEENRTDKTKALVWVSPSNPTGIVYSKEEAEKILKESQNQDEGTKQVTKKTAETKKKEIKKTTPKTKSPTKKTKKVSKK